ncbi:UDP-N-acetylmuramoylalanine--D-glutamate ligase [Echinicola pacifica]|uniref:UDP-N-acetylmuramoylalanine--D-glutamate ligase n=1 Tax=Echinicola pacifica TaxID=346377 RepID=A0A918UV18_9BACT|nr:UDP-N-acetylmuramoyl-L-alanine--D-glutamate ligase [Echinicola pacifica]GGZ36161.1 UDP-N-acetylmuramoylalanine--D-glutamate ligase [Echinicola pacifica]
MSKIAVLGAGESGLGAALLAHKQGMQVFVSDGGAIHPDRKTMLSSAGIEFEENGHTESRLINVDTLIKSPGIPYSQAVVAKAIANGVEVIDELEFASRYSSGKVIAISGTNGKTTTTLLTYHLLRKAGIDVGLAGNIGQSWAGQLVDGDHDWWVLEVSSFQIDGFISLKPDVAILTNITPDHLDRYEYKMEKYIESKLGLIKNMTANDHFVYFAEDKYTLQGLSNASSVNPARYPVALNTKEAYAGVETEGHLEWRVDQRQFSVAQSQIALKGKHNMLNALCAGMAALIAGVDQKSLAHGLETFVNAPHRMEAAGEVSGVRFVNDSKGTNVDATAYALAAYKEPLIWIAGGVDKGNDYAVLMQDIKDHVKMLICLGKDNAKLLKAFDGEIPLIKETQSVAEAVSWGLEYGKAGDVVLLSPACASFDLFKNYEDRGDQFKKAVKNLEA